MAKTDAVNFATKMIADIRNGMNAAAIKNGLPLPTDAEVELVVNQAFNKIKDKPYDDFVLHQKTISNHKIWLVEGPLFGFGSDATFIIVKIDTVITVPQRNLLLSSGIITVTNSGTPGKFPLPGNLVLSANSPIVDLTTGSKFPLSGNLVLSPTAPTVNLTASFIDDLSVTAFIDDVSEVSFTSDP